VVVALNRLTSTWAASSRLTCQQFIALENSVREGAIASGGAYSREMVGWLTP
jgi:hypothetical protein